MQIASESVSCIIGRVPNEGDNIPITSTLKLSVNMPLPQKTLVEAMIGEESLQNQATIFIENILGYLSTRKRDE